jgi:hypothetical protein
MRLQAGLLLLTLLSCRSSSPSDYKLVGRSTPENAQFTIRVVNHNVLDVTLYVVHDGHRERLGNATAATTAQFSFLLRRLGAGREFSLQADPIGSRTPVRTETFMAREGQIVTWTLESDFSRSTITVF